MDGEKKPGSDSVDVRSWGKEALNPIKSQLMQEEIEQEKVRNVNALPLPSEDQVRHWSRFLPLDESAVGVLFSRCGGAQPKHLRSFPDSVEFLKPISPYVAYQVHGEVNLIGVEYYAGWIRDTVGDTDLAEALRPYAEKETVTGRQLSISDPSSAHASTNIKKCSPTWTPTKLPRHCTNCQVEWSLIAALSRTFP